MVNKYVIRLTQVRCNKLGVCYVSHAMKVVVF